MKITDIYQAARDMASTRLEQARTGLFRALLHTELQRQQEEDDALAMLRALGDDGKHLRQAVALAAMDAPDRAVERLLTRLARGGEWDT